MSGERPDPEAERQRLQALLEQGRAEEIVREARRRLSVEPADAGWWWWLGRALEAGGRPAAARAAFGRAAFLDPRLPEGEAAAGPTPAWLEQLLAVPPHTVSACLIVRDEAEHIGRVLASLAGAVDEVVVADTGSRDDTPRLAARAGARVFHVPWQDDFSAARNAALERAGSEWVLWLDADETLDPRDRAGPRLAAGLFHERRPPAVVQVTVVNDLGSGPPEVHHDVARLFPLGRGLRFFGRAHEQVGPDPGGPLAGPVLRPAVRIRLHHDGYRPDVLQHRRKLERNIRLLELAVAEDPDDLLAWAFLGRERLLHGQPQAAVEALTRAEALAERTPAYGRLPELRTYLLSALLALGRREEAVEVGRRAVAAHPEYPPLWFGYGQALFLQALALAGAAGAAYREAVERSRRYQGLLPADPALGGWKGLLALGDVAKLQGDWTTAYTYYRQAAAEQPDAPGIAASLTHQRQQVEQLARLLAAEAAGDTPPADGA
ncbi:MAG: glycosyltransferase [Firmicutes bacterium]|nr:glycosyltransferase [Bacillota bacterium]